MTRISERAYAELTGKPAARKGKSKYHNERVKVDGELFDSVGESNYYQELKIRERLGEITDLRRQVTIEIQPAFTDERGERHKAITYKADFVYCDLRDNREHIVDYKGFKTDVYQLKKKLLAYKGIYIEEVN